MIALCALGASFAGCGRVDVNSPRIRGLAYVRLSDVVEHDPLYPQLSRIDDAIAMVTLAGAAPRVPRSAADIARQDAQLRAQVAAAKNRTRQIIAAKQREYAARERAAIATALAAAGVHGASNVAASLGTVSTQQARQAQVQAGRDFGDYQRSVAAQSNTAASAIVRQLQDEADQRLQAKALQEQQTETNLSLRLSQQDAARRLSIQTRLSMLALDAATRRQLQSQLSEMTSQENAIVGAQRAADRREFNAYRTQVMVQTNDTIRAQLAQITDQTRAKLVSKQSALGAQLRGAMQAPQAATHLTPATQAQLRRIDAQFQQQYRADAQDIIADYVATSDALEAQDAMLHGADAAAAGATQQEIGILQQRRQNLYDQIVARIEREARRLAQARGFRVVFSEVTAASGGYDMTNDLIHDIESEHE